MGTPSPWFDPAGVREVARRAVERCAPGEAELFDLVADGFFARGSVSLRGRPRRGELAGFDPDDIGALLNTGALMAATLAATGAVESFGATGSKGLVSRIGRWWQIRRPVPTDPNAPVAGARRPGSRAHRPGDRGRRPGEAGSALRGVERGAAGTRRGTAAAPGRRSRSCAFRASATVSRGPPACRQHLHGRHGVGLFLTHGSAARSPQPIPGRTMQVRSGTVNPNRSYNPCASPVNSTHRTRGSSVIVATSAGPSPAPRSAASTNTSAR